MHAFMVWMLHVMSLILGISIYVRSADDGTSISNQGSLVSLKHITHFHHPLSFHTPQGEEENNIRQKLKRQIQIIKGRRGRRLQTENPPTDNPNDGRDGGAAAPTTSAGTSTSAATTPMSADLLATFHEEEERSLQFCSRGLEHYFTPREERRVQTARQKSTIQAVLDRQRWQMVQCNVRPLDEASTIGPMFAEATGECRSDALERAAGDEAEARKVHSEWISPASVRTVGGE